MGVGGVGIRKVSQRTERTSISGSAGFDLICPIRAPRDVYPKRMLLDKKRVVSFSPSDLEAGVEKCVLKNHM